jgi:hypothetical protein
MNQTAFEWIEKEVVTFTGLDLLDKQFISAG